MTASERREALYDVLCQRRKDTVDHLADEFCVSKKTILRDIEKLSCVLPIETVRGRYGGVRVLEWHHPNRSRLCSKQLQLLRKMAKVLEGEELIVLNSIITQFAP